MKRLILYTLLTAGTLLAQTAGTITQTVTSTIQATTPTVSCKLTNSTPIAPAGVHVDCFIGANKVLAMDVNVTPGSPNGAVGSFTNAGDSVTWILTLSGAAGPYAWQIAANGTSKNGTF